ncbi:AraC-like DNA-binding protein [Devosia sp. UYZn731]|uniref:AraC family transcriptional regulator n=1 Tax=Devosia sp. UYZn731 TaxID=3156345 RepID=UPI0033917840
MTNAASHTLPNNAYYEHVLVPPEHTFLWRKDDYPWRRIVWNYHPEFEIHLIRHSSGLAYIGDYVGHFEPGHLVLVGSNLPHNWVTPGIGNARLAERDIVLQFDPERTLQAITILPELAQVGSLFRAAADGVEFMGETARRAAAILEDLGNKSGLAALAEFLRLLDVLSNSQEYRTLSSPEFASQFRPGSANEAERIERAIDYILSHFLAGISLTDVAEMVGMSDSAFSRLFKAQVGNTFSDHVNILRVWTARKLLSDTDMPVTNICFEAGFNNISNFNRTFLRQTGFKPSRYRDASRRRSPS